GDRTPEPVAWAPQPAAREPQWPPRAPVAEPPPPAAPGPVHWSQRKVAPPEAAVPSATHWSQRKPSQELPWRELEATVETALKDQSALPPPVADSEPTPEVEKLKRKSVIGRVMRRTSLAAILLALGIGGYFALNGDIHAPLLTKMAKYASNVAGDGKSAATAGSQAI